MKLLWILAHPEPQFLNATLAEQGLAALDEIGHTYQVSDLYAVQWKAAVDRHDYPEDDGSRLRLGSASLQAHRTATLSHDVRAEQRKLEWVDLIVLQFPFWWYSMPAILKGWIDRVFAKGFAYGITDPHDPSRTLRYGDVPLAGNTALTIATSGSPAPALGPRGINGQLDEILFPLLHGTLWYVGIAALTPMCVHDADHATDADFASATWGQRRHLQSADAQTAQARKAGTATRRRPQTDRPLL